jgi:hypothetical protein
MTIKRNPAAAAQGAAPGAAILAARIRVRHFGAEKR